MRPDKTITLYRAGNRMVVDPSTSIVKDTLEPALSYVAMRILFGAEKKMSIASGGSGVEETPFRCYGFDHRNRISTSFGFYRRITDELKKKGYGVVVNDLQPHAHPEWFDPDWDRLFNPDNGIVLRYGQDEFLMKAAANIKSRLPCRFDAVPGYGKGFLMSCLGLMYPRLKIHIATKRVPVLKDRLYPELCQYLPDVGICCGSVKKMGHRVQLFSFDSLHHSIGDADILIVDECHESATDDACTQLAKYDKSVNLGFSATHDMRLDNKDMRVEAMFGPVVYKIPYQEAVDNGLVVPIEVIWSDVVMDENPVEGVTDSTTRKRRGIWRNSVRNEIIAADARRYDDDTQVLITCETIEHVLTLKTHLPEFEVIYAAAGVDDEDEKYFRQLGVWPDDMERMTQDRRDKITGLFERGHLKKVICNTVWNVGVNFKQLGVLIRADAGGTPTMDTQIPGRTSRVDPLTGKSKGTIHDYRDQFDHGFKQRAARRKSNYARHGWTQLDASGRLLVGVDEEDAPFRSRSRRGREEPDIPKPPKRGWIRK